MSKAEFKAPEGDSLDFTEDLSLEVGGQIVQPSQGPDTTSLPTHFMVSVPPAERWWHRIHRSARFAWITLLGRPLGIFLPIHYCTPYWVRKDK